MYDNMDGYVLLPRSRGRKPTSLLRLSSKSCFLNLGLSEPPSRSISSQTSPRASAAFGYTVKAAGRLAQGIPDSVLRAALMFLGGKLWIKAFES